MLQGNRVGTPNIFDILDLGVVVTPIAFEESDFIVENPPANIANVEPLGDNQFHRVLWNGADDPIGTNQRVLIGHVFQIETPSDGDTAAIELVLAHHIITHGNFHITPVWAPILATQMATVVTTLGPADLFEITVPIGRPTPLGVASALQSRTDHLITQMIFTATSGPEEWTDVLHFVGWQIENATGGPQDLAAFEISCGIRQLNNAQQRAARDPKFK